MPSTTLTLIGKTPQKPKRGFVLEDAKHFKGNWNNYALSFTIKPISKGSGWRSIIHNTMTGEIVVITMNDGLGYGFILIPLDFI